MPQGPPDQQPPESVIFQSFSGVKNTVSRERLGPNDLEKALNVDIDDTGQVRRRRGFSKVDLSAWRCLRGPIAGKWLGVRDNVLVSVNTDYSVNEIADASGDVCYADVANDIYVGGSVSLVLHEDGTTSPWGSEDGQNRWVSPVIAPTETLGAISGKLVGPPPSATIIEAYKGRIYLAVRNVLWATELYRYHFVDKTKNFMQFEDDITLVMAVDDGLYVGTETKLYFLKGVFGKFQLSTVVDAGVLRGSGVWVPADLVNPNARNGFIQTGNAAVMMTQDGIVAGFDGGNVYNLTHDRVIFPGAIGAAALYRQDQGANSYVAAMDSAGGPAANMRIGDYVDAEIIRAADRTQGG